MKETRRIGVHDRKFGLVDLKRIAAIFERQRKLATKSDHHASVSFQVHFSDDTTMEADSPEILGDDVLCGPRRPVCVRFIFFNFALERHIELNLTHGDNTSMPYNSASISGIDQKWVRENFLTLQEAIEAAPPQTIWLRKHKTLLFHGIALGVGSLVCLCFGLIIDALDLFSFIKPLPKDSPIRRHLVLVYMLLWFLRWLAGVMPAFDIREWLFRLWPSVELDIGSEHLKSEKTQRKRLVTVGTLIVLPIVTMAIYDLIGFIF